MSPDSFATGIDYLLDRTVEIGMNGVSFGDHSYTDLDFADDVCLLVELMELLVPVLEALATAEAESLGLEVNWQKTMMQALGNIQDVPLPSQCWSKRLAQWRNLFTWVLLSTRQLTALQTSSDGVHSCVQQCRALTSSSGCRESRCQLSWGSTTPVYCQFSCMGQSAGRLPRKTHAGSMPSINSVSICFLASSGITSSPTLKFDARPTNLYLRKLSRHGVYSGISPEWTTI